MTAVLDFTRISYSDTEECGPLRVSLHPFPKGKDTILTTGLQTKITQNM